MTNGRLANLARQLGHRILGTEDVPNEHIRWGAPYVVSRDIEGDYYEFGVHEGGSFAYAYQMLERERAGMNEFRAQKGLPPDGRPPIRYFAFDSFEGLPEPKGADKTAKLPSHWQAGIFSSSKDRFLANLRAQGVDTRRVTLVEGWYENTLNAETARKHAMRAGCIFHVDCDFYESTRDALNFITDLYVDGSLIIFDDWTGFRGNPKYGEQKAWYEWQEKNNVKASEFIRSRGQSVSFILHKDD